MRASLIVAAMTLAACGDDAGEMNPCGNGMHLEGEMCVPDTTCMASTCGAHGTCSATGGVLTCACEDEYAGMNCQECAVGFQDRASTGVCMPACATQCGRFGNCDDSDGNITCTCSAGTTGATCADCVTPTATIVNDTFGASGVHHTLDVTAGAIIVAQLPTVGAAMGQITFGPVTGMPAAGSQSFTLAFSRCPGELSWAQSQIAGGMRPCTVTTTATTASVHWIEDGEQTATTCVLPPGDGPWYANLKVDFIPSTETCDNSGPCKMDWTWQ